MPPGGHAWNVTTLFRVKLSLSLIRVIYLTGHRKLQRAARLLHGFWNKSLYQYLMLQYLRKLNGLPLLWTYQWFIRLRPKCNSNRLHWIIKATILSHTSVKTSKEAVLRCREHVTSAVQQRGRHCLLISASIFNSKSNLIYLLCLYGEVTAHILNSRLRTFKSTSPRLSFWKSVVDWNTKVSGQLPSLPRGSSGETSKESEGSTGTAGLTGNTESVSEFWLWLDGERALDDNMAFRFSAGKKTDGTSVKLKLVRSVTTLLNQLKPSTVQFCCKNIIQVFSPEPLAF